MKGTAVLIVALVIFSACLQEDKAEPKKEETETVVKKAAPEQKVIETPPAPEIGVSFNLLWNFPAGDKVYGVALSGNGTKAAVGSYDGALYLLNDEGEVIWKYRTKGGIHDVAMSRDGAYVAAVSYVYDTTTVHLLSGEGKRLWNLSIPGLAKGVDVDQNGRVAVASYLDKVYMVEEGGIAWAYTVPDSPYGVWDVVIAGDRVVAVDDSAYLYVFTQRGKILRKTLVARKDYPYGVAATSDGYVAVVTMKGAVYLYKDGKLRWKRETGSPRERLVADYGVAFSSSADFLAVGSWDGNLYIYGIEGKRLLKQGVGGHVNRVDFSGSRLMYGSADGRAYLAEISWEK